MTMSMKLNRRIQSVPIFVKTVSKFHLHIGARVNASAKTSSDGLGGQFWTQKQFVKITVKSSSILCFHECAPLLLSTSLMKAAGGSAGGAT